MDVKLSRRQLALAAVTAASVTGQAPASAADAPDDLTAARQQNAANAAALNKVDVPQATEPAVHFRA